MDFCIVALQPGVVLLLQTISSPRWLATAADALTGARALQSCLAPVDSEEQVEASHHTTRLIKTAILERRESFGSHAHH
jgi:hypothetical protein